MAGFIRAIRRTAARLTQRRSKKKKRPEKPTFELMSDEDVEGPMHTDFINELTPGVDSSDGKTTAQIHLSPGQSNSKLSDRKSSQGTYETMETDPDTHLENTVFSSGDSEHETGGTSRIDGTKSKHKSRKWKHGKLRQKISATIFHPDLEKCDPEVAVNLMRFPNLKSFSSLKKKIEHSKGDWIQGFLDAGGLDVLFDFVDNVGTKRVHQLSDAMLVLECVACIKTVLNSRLGLDYLIQHGDYTKKLVKALDTNNVMVKKQVFELLSALCVYSPEGYGLSLEALETFKKLKKQRYRFSLIVNELKMAELTPYKTTIMAYINCIIVATESLDDRMSIRNEFIGLNILDIINNLRDEDDEDLIIQCDVFDDEKQSDDDEYGELNPEVVDLNDHKEVFQAVFQKVYNTPHCDAFLTILQTLLQIDPNSQISDTQWNFIETAVRRTVLADSFVNKPNSFSSVVGSMFPAIKKPQSVPKCIQTDLELTHQTKPVISPSTGETQITQSSCKFCNNAWMSDTTNNNNICDKTNSVQGNIDNIASGISNKLPNNIQEAESNVVQQINMPSCSIPPDVTDTVSVGAQPPPAPPPPPLPHQNNPTVPPNVPTVPPSVCGSAPPPPPPPPPLPGSLNNPSCGVPPPPPPPPPVPGGAPPPPPPPPPIPGGAPPPPPPPPVPGGVPPPPPPPPGPGGVPPPPPPPPGPGGVPPPPPPPPGGSIRAVPANLSFASTIPPQPKGLWTPTPKHKMRVFNWTKVPPQTLRGHDSVWKDILDMEDEIKVEYDIIEQLFCQKILTPKVNEKKKEHTPKEILLLDTKKSMNVNIFLKQFKCPNKEIVAMVEQGDVNVIGQERLRGLQKILPEAEDIACVKAFDGDKTKLGNAEKFYLILSDLPAYKQRIEGMVLKDDFRIALDMLKPNIGTYIRGIEHLMDNESFKVFLRFILHTGNFLNAGGYAGNAVGFKINSLNKLMDTRANKPRLTLLHYLVEEARKENDQTLAFVDEMYPDLSAASRYTLETLTGEMKQISGSVTRFSNQLKGCPDDVRNQLSTFVSDAKSEIKDLESDLQKVDDLSNKLAEHFCENEKTFKLEECITTMKTFCEKVQQCDKENKQRKLQEEKAEKRRKQQAEMKAKSKNHKKELPSQEDDGCIIDRLLTDIRKGYKLRKTTSSPAPSRAPSTKLKSEKNRTLSDSSKHSENVDSNC